MSDNTPKPAAKHRRKRKSSSDKTVALWVAVISGIVSITLAIIAFPPLVTFVNSRWNASPTPQPTLTPFVITSETSATIKIDTPENTPTFTETLPPPSPTDPPTTTPQAASEVMTAQLTFSSSAGNAPLMVNFNARNSYLTRPNQPTLTCIEKNVCSYTWEVRLGGTTIYGPSLGDSAFSYTFQKKGEYIVVVTVCRGGTCNYAAASISVK